MRRRPAIAALLGMLLCAACSTPSGASRDAPVESPPRLESRVGIPVLMDLPVVGVLFGRRTVVR